MKKHNYFILFLLAVLPLSVIFAEAHAGFDNTNNGRGTQSVKDVTPSAIVFNGVELSGNLSSWAWGQSSFALEEGAGNVPGRNAMKWVQGNEWGNGWTGVGVTADPVFDLGSVWQTDSATITLKCEEGVGALRIQYEGGGGKVGKVFTPIADGQWHKYTIALKDMVPQDNTTGFDSAHVNVVGIMAEASGVAGKVIYITDWWTGHPAISFPAIFFNGIAVPSRMAQFTWGQSQLAVETGAGVVANSNALKWIQGNEWNNGWTGAGYNIDPKYDLSGAWAIDTMTATLKCEPGVGALRFQIEGGTGKKGITFTPVADNTWKTYKFALKDFIYEDNTTGFDSANVAVVQIMAEASGVAGKVVYITDWWTGHPNFDVIPPNAPAGVSAFNGPLQNIIQWTDVPGETKETYSVYYSKDPITDVKAAGVEVAKTGIAENTGLFEHLLFAPAVNQNTSYYYAVTCTDAAGNVSAVSTNTPVQTNTAKGMPSWKLNGVTNFVADGNLNEWASVTPIVIKPSDGSGHIVANTTVGGDADLSAKAYLAMDANYMYVAFDITDDVMSFSAQTTTYLNDCADLYVGLYNWHGAPHSSLQRGAQPDYHFRFLKEKCILDGGADSILIPGASYYFDEQLGGNYIVEAKIPFAVLAQKMKDSLFVPVEGMRLPLDIGLNDADATASREGIMFLSPYSEDHSYEHVWRWVYNWIGDKWFVGNEKIADLNEKNYSLSQNYPNPFNPATRINYSVKQSGMVTLKIYDIMGREVATLVNEVKNAGAHTVTFNAANLSSGVYFYTVNSGDRKSVV